MSSKITWSAHNLKVNWSEIFEVGHWDVKYFKRMALLLFIIERYPKESISISRFMRRMIEELLIPMRMSFHWNELRKHYIFNFWSSLRML